MLNIKPQELNKKGFTIIELALSICLVSMLSMTLFSILGFSMRTSLMAEVEDEILLHGRFGIEYIKEEIKSADKIISTNKINNFNKTYPKNIGFIIMELRGLDYYFISYYQKDDKLIRIAGNKSDSNTPIVGLFKGFNEICSNVLSIEDTNLDLQKGLINLSLSMGNENKEVHCFRSTLYVNPILDL